MTYADRSVLPTITGLLNAHPELDAAADGALDNLDQFHIGGTGAVDLLIPTLGLAAGDVVLDVGSGFGGPARHLARRTGNRVVGIDINPFYVEAARELTERAGLHDLVRFETADIAGFQHRAPFRAAITMHVQMNVPDKRGWFGDIGRHLAPGARLAMWEVCAPGRPDLAWPMPWSLDGRDSHVVDAETLLNAVERAGFRTVEWAPESAWVRDWIATTLVGGLPAGPALPMLLDDGYARVLNFAAALGDGSLEIWRGAFTR